MDIQMSSISVAFFMLVIFISMEAATFVQGQGNEGSKNEKTPKKGALDAASTHYDVLTPLPSGQERAFCQARGACNHKTLVCPSECPERKPKKNKQEKGCFIDCSSKCEVTCKCKPPLLSYRPDYVSPVKRGVPMPMMGGEDKYQTPSLYSPLCNFCRFQRPSGFIAIEGVAQY